MDYDLNPVRELLAELRENGSKVRVGDVDDLQVRGDLGPELLERLREHKPAVLSYLRSPPTWPCESCRKFSFPIPGFLCYWCREKESGPDGTRSALEGETRLQSSHSLKLKETASCRKRLSPVLARA